MAFQQSQWKIKGMRRDLDESVASNEFAYENMNFRILATDDNTTLALTNEKGNSKIPNIELEGTAIGTAVINNHLVVFTTGNKDRIYCLDFVDESVTSKLLYSGNLEFDIEHPLETLAVYENENIQKIYWVDGKNQPRVINIMADLDKVQWDNDSSPFDFVKTLTLSENVTIEKNKITNGIFPSGTIQYCLSYYTSFGQESNIFYTSPLLYISDINKGNSPEDTVSTSFTINISNVETQFEYVRIYSIIHTTEDAAPQCKVVADIPITGNTLSFTDSGTTGRNIDPTELLYIGGEEITASTLTQKDNTLFLGNLELKRHSLNPKIIEDIQEEIKQPNKGIQFIPKQISNREKVDNYYNHAFQLNQDASKILTFKSGETYRFGLQAQHKSGKWSEPIFLEDLCNHQLILYDYDYISLSQASLTLSNSAIIDELKAEDYIKVRPVIVYPSLQDRSILCQGIVCPTVYNVNDRFNNAPFVQSSWFLRPDAPYDVTAWNQKFGGSNTNSLGARGYYGAICNSNYYLDNNAVIDLSKTGKWAEFRHNYPIPSNDKPNAEIQCLTTENSVIDNFNTKSREEWVSQNQNSFYVDKSILTLHSPDIEFDNSLQTIDLNTCKFRLVGLVPISSSISDIDIQTSTGKQPFYNGDLPLGFYKETVSVINDANAWKQQLAAPLWYDEISNSTSTYQKANKNNQTWGFVVYPWHRNGSLNNMRTITKDTTQKVSLLSKKQMSNLRYSENTTYIDYTTWDKEISGVGIFNSNEQEILKIKAPEGYETSYLTYSGNIDKVITPNRLTSGLTIVEGDIEGSNSGYPIMTVGPATSNDTIHNLYNSIWYYPNGRRPDWPNSNAKYASGTTDKQSSSATMLKPLENLTTDSYGTDPVRMQYKTTPHAVLALQTTATNQKYHQNVLPTLKFFDPQVTSSITLNEVSTSYNNYETPFWSNSIIGVNQDIYEPSFSWFKGFLWLGELYRDEVINRFGGTSQEAIENNQWLPCGDAVSLNSDSVTLIWNEGDTYYQRYDNLKTYPSSFDDQNQITDIISFMCETHINLDGRYDKNRGKESNLNISPNNFNKLNPVYSSKNNFFTYRALNYDRSNLDKFPNTITWTKTKNAGELIDTWTNITLASTLDFDGDKGPINALKRYKDSILAFQDTGISQVLYNESTQITTTAGVPIEIANSGKVTGKRYLSNQIGCTNKWSICETPNNLYFIDNIARELYMLNEGFTPLAKQKGFTSFFSSRLSNKSWNPSSFQNFVSYYDEATSDVYFIDKDYCIAYNEGLGEFSSFYNYENTPYIININDKSVNIKDGYLWTNRTGDYNMFYGEYKPFYTRFIVNSNPTLDKTFNQIEFRSDSWQNNILQAEDTFDTLTAWNEYQYGQADLEIKKDVPSTLKRKFRIWRANIPRNQNSRDRIRNPWAYIELKKMKPNTNKLVLHDIVVNYYQ